MAQKLTKRSIDALKTDKMRGQRVYDSELSGFGVTVYTTGRKVFWVVYGPKNRRRRVTIGPFGPLTVNQARDKAKALLGQVALGADPASERDAEAAVQTFGVWCDSYLGILKDRKRTWKKDNVYLELASARWGERPLGAITAEDVRKLFEHVREHGVSSTEKLLKGDKGRKISQQLKARWADAGPKNTLANRWLASVRACFSAAWREDLIPANPAMKVKPLPENSPRQMVLKDEEFLRVVSAVAKLPDPFMRAAFTLLIETGARSSEVLRAKWEDIDLDGRIWRLPNPKSGRPQVIPLVDATVAMLRNLPRLGPYLIPGKDPKKHRSDLTGIWDNIRKAAEIGDVHIHDIRRTFGLQVARSAGLHVASKLLRHSTIGVTEKVYAPLGIDELRKAAEKVSKGRGKVLQMRRK